MQDALKLGGCVLTGPAGVGKSRLAVELCADWPGHLEVLATRSASGIPFGAFAHLLNWERTELATLIPGFVKRLRADFPAAPPLLLVDDAQWLDDASAALVLTLATTGAVVPLLTLRSAEPVPDAIVALWKERGLPRIPLERLPRADVEALACDLLGGPLHAVTVERIDALSEGLPLYVVELIRDAQRTGALDLDQGRWHWNEQPMVFDRLGALVARSLGALSTEAQRAFEFVAVGGTLERRTLESLAGGSAPLEELERGGVIRVRVMETGDEVSPAHPLFGEVIANGLGHLATTRIKRSLALALQARDTLAENDRIRLAVWLLDAGESQPDLYLASSALALRSGTPMLALRLAEGAGSGLHAALARAAALIDLCRFEQAEALLTPLQDQAAAADLVTAMNYVESLFRARLSGPFADEAVNGLLDLAADWHDNPHWAAFIAMLRNWVLQPANRPREALALLEPWRHSQAISGYARFHVLAAAYHAQLRLGQIDDAIATADDLHVLTQSQTDRPWLMTYSELVFQHLPKICAGRALGSLAACLQAQIDQATAGSDPSARAVSAMALGLLLLRRGHAAQACLRLGEAADRFEAADPGFDAIITLSQLAMASALCGDRERAEQALRRAEYSGRNQPRMLRRYQCELQHARILIAASNGSFSNKVERLFALADAGLEHPTEEADILYNALRFGARPARVASALARRVRATQNELIELMRAHAAAMAAESAAGLLDMARIFAARGLDLYAAEAAAGAARAHYAAGDLAAAGAAVALSRRHLGDCGRVISPALLIPMMVPALTRRELEIARLAAQGLSNRAIADALFVSVRTAESYVLRACRKLGVYNRKALARILSPED